MISIVEQPRRNYSPATADAPCDSQFLDCGNQLDQHPLKLSSSDYAKGYKQHPHYSPYFLAHKNDSKVNNALSSERSDHSFLTKVNPFQV